MDLLDWRSAKSSLGESLSHIFEIGFYSDVAFLVGEDEFRINAHKTILSARSEPFAAMFHERWSPTTEEEIKMPLNNKTAVKPFLKYLYTDLISLGGMEIDDILEITQLAHMYQVHKLLSQCIVYLNQNITEKNCFQIYKSCQLLDKTLSDEAFRYFLTNIVPTAKFNNSYLNWDFETIQKIILDERQHVSEKTLFKALLKWNTADNSRNDCFLKLLPNIRFPTMTANDFAKEVLPANVLTNEEMLEVFAYIATQEGSVKFPTKPRQSTVSKTNTAYNSVVISEPTAIVNWNTFYPMAHNTFANFHKFRLVISPWTCRRSHTFDNRILSSVKLHGMQFFAGDTPGNDINGMLEYLKSTRCRLQIAVCNDTNGMESDNRIISKTIGEIEQNGLRAYFNYPLEFCADNAYSIAARLESQERVMRQPFNSRFPLGELKTEVSANFIGSDFNLTLRTVEGTYCLIHKLLFAPANELQERQNDCNIS